jgi:hypothetical protein
MGSTWDNGSWDVGFWDGTGGSLPYKKMKVIVQTCTGDPGVEANWHYADTAVKSSGTLSGLASGKVWVRVCARGADAKNGPWSDPAEEVVR